MKLRQKIIIILIGFVIGLILSVLLIAYYEAMTDDSPPWWMSLGNEEYCNAARAFALAYYPAAG